MKILFSLAIPVLFALPQIATANPRQNEPASTAQSTPIIHPKGTTQPPLPISTELPFRLLSGFLIQVRGEIAGRTGLNFLLDTGSTISLIDNRIADQLRLSAQPAQTFGIGAKAIWRMATVSHIRLGQIQARNVDVMVGDLSAFSAYAKGIDAVIGTDLLKLSNFSIDYAANKIVFQPNPREYTRRAAQSPSAQSASAQPLSDCVTLELQIQGHPVTLIVDTGFPGVLLYEEHLRSAIPELKFLGALKSVIMGESLHGQQGVLPDVLLGSRTAQITVFITRDPSAGSLSGFDGIVGLPPLKARRVNFDFLKKRLSWE